jgi:pilus assembly protein TadC
MIYLLLLTILAFILYLWFLKPLVFYLRAIIAFGTKGVILIYRPFISNTKYMRERNKIDGDSMAEIKRKLQ